jgi:dihydrodipicolinate synthase/N-acetylneuraminate lyase
MHDAQHTAPMQASHVARRLQPGRRIEGISAVLLPFDTSGAIDWDSFKPNIKRTLDVGIAPALNMDTGYTNLLAPEQRTQVLEAAREVSNGAPFVAGAFIEGQDGAVFDLYARAVDEITAHGGTPILFQSTALKALSDAEKVALYAKISERVEKFYAFELGEMFLPFGEIYSLDIMRDMMQIPTLAGAKHSSLNRELEWQRLDLRDQIRPDFKVFTGNDLAIDLVAYGSDYLLGLSAFCPEAFALRDRLWLQDDARFWGLNDLIQYLGFFAFRPAVPAYKHTAAQFLKLRGRIESDNPHPKAARRPESDIEILRDISARLDAMMNEIQSGLEPLPLHEGGAAI